LHIGEFLLHQLRGGQRPAELLALQRILPGRMPACFGCAQRAEGDTEARAIETGKRRAKTFGARQQCVFRRRHILQHDFAGNAGAQREFSIDARGGKTFGAAFHLAQTSARSAMGALVIHIFAPERR